MFLFDPDKLEQEDKNYKNKISEPDFWNNSQKAQEILKASKLTENKLNKYKELKADLEDVQALFELAEEEDSLENDLILEIKKLKMKVDEFSVELLLSEKYDSYNAIISVHAGTGGMDAQDWAGILLRMYTRFASSMNYKMYQLDLQQDDESGIKSATFQVVGENAYGYLKCEKGVHRLVRISPFDSSGKRHTSFASVDVLPELEEEDDIVINPKDLKIDTYRASGAGGQHVNKTDSAIRITHLPTRIVVQCQNERSQFSNKDTAMKMLKAKLIELKELEHKDKIEDLQGEYSQIAWGSQIRSYVFQPYTLVKDHRTNYEVGNITSVLDGDIMPFINAYLVFTHK